MMIYDVFEHVAMNKPVMAAVIAAGTAFLASLVSFLSWRRIHADRWSIRWPGRSDPVDSPHATHLMVEAKPRPEDVRFLEEGLYEFNARATGISDGKLLSLFVRTADGSPIAGAFGWTWGGTCYIRYLFVVENMRGHGQGTMLMRAIQKEANSRDCRQIVLETFDFQAFAFYQKFGFEEVGRVEDYPLGHQYLILVKRLP